MKDVKFRMVIADVEFASPSVAVMFTVKLDGTVGDVEIVENTVGSDALAECVAAEVGRASFPPPDGDVVRIRYPFVFQ